MADLSELMTAILSANVKTLRLRLGDNQTEFAERLNVSQGTVSRWESGSKPEVDQIVALAELAGVPVQEFTNQPLSSAPRQVPMSAGGAIYLPVQLPSEAALSQMFEALLGTVPANLDQPEVARMLAQLLPGALAETVSHLQAGTSLPDQPQPPATTPAGRSKSHRPPLR